MSKKDRETKVGDLVVITATTKWFATGDKAVLIRCDDGGDWWADFNGQGNPFVYKDGRWCIGNTTVGQFRLADSCNEKSQ